MTRICYILILIMLMGCSDHIGNDRLAYVADIVAESPEEALACLDSIKYGSLSEADRNLYDLLTVKACDKAYITHTSDSLIRKVIGYERQHKGNGLLPEALYYGGRVYSDMGDAPNALHYFHEALDNLPEEDEYSVLRLNILSQTGRLLTEMRLYDVATPYIEDAIGISSHNCDTLRMVYDLQLLGGTHMRAGRNGLAERYFRESMALSGNLPPYHAAKSRMYIAAAKYKMGEIDSALCYIRGTYGAVRPMVRNSVLGYASNIYLEAGILDTAFICARELVTNDDPTHKEIGYQVLLSPRLRHYIPSDSLDSYISAYRTILEDFYDENENQAAVNQLNLYNYQMHERERMAAEKKAALLKWLVMSLLMVIILIALVSLYYKNKSKDNIIELQCALSHIDRLKSQLNLSRDDASAGDITDAPRPVVTGSGKKTEQELRDRLKAELLSIYESGMEHYRVADGILQTEAYDGLQEYIADGRMIKEDDPLWGGIESAVVAASPKFLTNLRLLTAGNLTRIDLHTALLIKCGIKPSKMMILMGRSNGAIVSRRETLSMKIFGEKKGTKLIDSIIRLL